MARRNTRLGTLGVLCLMLHLGAAPRAEARKAKDADEPIVADGLGVQLDEALTSKLRSFWGSVLVARKGEILLAKGYGAADYAARPNTPRTLHELASASKQIVGAAIVHLQQRRKLSLDDSIERFFKNVPKDKAGITVRQLLTHTSGISGSIGVPYGSTLARGPYVREMLSKPLASEPGTKFEYCNVGYALLAAIVEEATGKDYEAYVEKHLFKPAGMKDSGFIGDRDLEETERASTRKGRQRGKTAADWFYGWGYRGMGGVVSTVLDLHRWDRALRGGKILKPKSLAALHESALEGYAAGWIVETTDRGTRRASHSGSVEGYGSQVVRFLEDDALIVVLSNDGALAGRALSILEPLLFEPVSIPVEIDVSGHGGGGKVVKVGTALAWDATRKKDEVVLTLRDDRDEVVSLRLPRKGYAPHVVAELARATTARARDDDGKPAATEGILYLKGYGPAARIQHAHGALDVMSSYRHRTAAGESKEDLRVSIVLKDTRSGGWTGLFRLNLAAANELLAAMQEATGKGG